MKFMDTLTEMVAGRNNMEKCEQRAFQSFHQKRGTEESLRRLTCVVPERPPSELSSQCSITSGPSSSPATSNTRTSFTRTISLRVRPHLHRSYSTNTTEVPAYMPSDNAEQFTTADPVESEFKSRLIANPAYDSTLWPLPPMLPCRGIGRYRMGEEAEPQVQYDMLRRNLSIESAERCIESGIFHPDDAVFQRYMADHGSRSNSFASAMSSASLSSSSVIDAATGTRITRGFMPSNSSSASSSYKESRARAKPNAASLTTSPVKDVRNDSQVLHRHLSNRKNDLATSISLGTIAELRRAPHPSYHKLEKPCAFLTGGDPDSAVASDDEDGEWIDSSENNIRNARPPMGQTASRTSKRAPLMSREPTRRPHRLCYSRAVAAARTDAPANTTSNRTDHHQIEVTRVLRPQFRRSHSRPQANVFVKQTMPQKNVLKSNLGVEGKPMMKHDEVVSEEHNVATPSIGSDGLSESPGLWMADTTHPKNRPLHDDAQLARIGKCNDLSQLPETGRRRSDTAFRVQLAP